MENILSNTHKSNDPISLKAHFALSLYYTSHKSIDLFGNIT